MIPQHELENTFSYAYVAGCRNALWLVGRVAEVDHENKIIRISRATNESTIPAYFEKNDRIPEDTKVGDAVKLICHIYSGATEGEIVDIKSSRHAKLVVKYIGRPTLLDMRAREGHADFKPVESLESFEFPDSYTPASNYLEIAGIVDTQPTLVKDNDSEKDRLVFTIRQSPSAQNAIPVELHGKHAKMYQKIVNVGDAVYVPGEIVSRLKPGTNEYVAIVRTIHVRQVQVERDFKFETAPEWVQEIRARQEQLIKQKLAEAAARKAMQLVQSAA